MNEYGKRIWFFPDGDRPPFGDSPLKGHESIVVLNPNKGQAVIKITFYYEDREPVTTDEIVVEAERVCCMKTHEEKYFKDKTQLTGTQYALKVVFYAVLAVCGIFAGKKLRERKDAKTEVWQARFKTDKPGILYRNGLCD